MVFSSLMMGIMQELGLHVTNFGSVVNRFNDELSMKSYVLIDEGVMFLTSCIELVVSFAFLLGV